MIKRTAGTPKTADDITFTVKLEGKDDADFSPVEVEAGKSISVEIVAVVFASEETESNLQYKLYLAGKDDADNDAGNANKDLAPMSFVENSSINVSTNASMKQQDVILANKGQNLATFNVKPANKASTANLDKLVFTLEGFDIPADADLEDYFELSVGNDTDNNMSLNGSELTVSDIDIDITAETKVALNYVEKLSANGVTKTVTEENVTYKTECANTEEASDAPVAYDAEGTTTAPAPTFYSCTSETEVEVTSAPEYVVTLKSVNGGDDLGTAYKYNRTVVNSLVRVVSMKGNKESETTYVFDIEYSDDANNEKISSVVFTYENDVK